MLNCENCVHSMIKSPLNGGGLECRRNPPHVLLVPTQQGMQGISVSPSVQPDYFCGEFKLDELD